jgi:hypothetical protein
MKDRALRVGHKLISGRGAGQVFVKYGVAVVHVRRSLAPDEIAGLDPTRHGWRFRPWTSRGDAMKCTPIDLGNGVTGIVCSRGSRARERFCACGGAATKLCDFPKPARSEYAMQKTCSKPLCDGCAVRFERTAENDLGGIHKAGAIEDHCPEHSPAPPAVVARRPGATVPLIVHTARLTYGGPDRFDVTRAGDHPHGVAFAPSWAILNEFRRGKDLASAWAGYVPAYTNEMRRSYRENRAVWSALLARESVTLVCFCADHTHCHRTLLAGILEKLGATVAGERSAGEQRRVSP